MRGEETTDELRGYGLRVIQPRGGYRFSLDPLLLADFAAVREGERVIDLGTGCGVIPLILARTAADSTIVGVEFQEEMALLAQRNVRLNGLSDRVEIVGADVLDLGKMYPASSFDVVVANPPYRKQGTGKTSPKAGRDKARHETTAGLADFVALAKRLVKTGGRVCLIYHVSRLSELFTAAEHLRLAPARLRMVHGTARASAQMVLLEMVKGRRCDLEVMPPLIVYESAGNYGSETKRILGEQVV